MQTELTTQEAADLLNVPRPHFIKLLETRALPYRRAGKHRLVRFDDLMKFKAERDRASERAMSELAKQAQELKLGMSEALAIHSRARSRRLPKS